MGQIECVSLRRGSPRPPPNAMPTRGTAESIDMATGATDFRHRNPSRAPHQQVAQIPRRRAARLGRRHGFRRRSGDLRGSRPAGPQSGIRLRRARGCARRRLHPPHAAPLQLADRSRRRASHRRSGAGQLLLGDGVQRAGRRGAVATAVLSAVHGRDQRHRPPPDRQPDARQRHALGARPRRLRGRTRSARPRADLLPSAEPHRTRLQPRGTRSRWRRSPSVTT